jgi:pimeloyl-ACP methyl ester carboxylesterase
MIAFQWIDGVGGEIIADGKRLEAVAYGPPPDQAPTIVMLHEGLGCVALWRDFPAKLAAATGHGVFAYSRVGYGGSERIDLPRPLDYMSREARFSLPAVLEAIGFERGILLGHSDGASIAAIYAGEHSDERMKGLVLMAPHVFTDALMRRAICGRSSPNITPTSTAPFAAGTGPGSIQVSGPGISRTRWAAGPSLRFSFRAWTINTEQWRRSAPLRPGPPPPSRASFSKPAVIRRRSTSQRRRSTPSPDSAPRPWRRRRREPNEIEADVPTAHAYEREALTSTASGL